MAKHKDPSSAINTALTRALSNAFGSSVIHGVNVIKQRARESTERFYTVLTTPGKFMGVEEPNPELGVAWPRLTQPWIDYKDKLRAKYRMEAPGDRERIRANKGKALQKIYLGVSPLIGGERGDGLDDHLMNILHAKDALAVLGEPKITVEGDGKGNPEIRMLSNGRLQWRAGVYRDGKAIGGQFAPNTESFSAIVHVQLFPNFSNTKGAIRNPLDLFAPRSKQGLGGKIGKLEKQRPLFRAYTRWYLQQVKKELMG